MKATRAHHTTAADPEGVADVRKLEHEAGRLWTCETVRQRKLVKRRISLGCGPALYALTTGWMSVMLSPLRRIRPKEQKVKQQRSGQQKSQARSGCERGTRGGVPSSVRLPPLTDTSAAWSRTTFMNSSKPCRESGAFCRGGGAVGGKKTVRALKSASAPNLERGLSATRTVTPRIVRRGFSGLNVAHRARAWLSSKLRSDLTACRSLTQPGCSRAAPPVRQQTLESSLGCGPRLQGPPAPQARGTADARNPPTPRPSTSKVPDEWPRPSARS
jgi:hypothetical protein